MNTSSIVLDSKGRVVGGLERSTALMSDKALIKFGGWQMTHLNTAILREASADRIASLRGCVAAFLAEAAVRGIADKLIAA